MGWCKRRDRSTGPEGKVVDTVTRRATVANMYSYHGDTIGAMDASEPCVFNAKVDWYRGRGFWFDYPTFKLREGRWVVEPPKGM
jgi:hypothetical protein